MQYYSVGPDEAHEWAYGVDQKNYEWIVYWYQIGDYCGDGEAVGLAKDGSLKVHNMGHCSCYGPFEDWGTANTTTVDDFFAEKTSIHDEDYRNEVKAKVAELLGREWEPLVVAE